jgi:hypothetical protein
VHIALRAPAVFGPNADLDDIIPNCLGLDVHEIELAATAVEALLGKPTVPAWWLEMPENGFETGALPLEEEILHDEVTLARHTFATRVRDWRASVPLTPLEAVHRRHEEGKVRIAVVTWPDLSRMSDIEVDYAFNLAATLRADAISTPLVAGEPRRLAPFAERHAMRVGFHGDMTTRPGDFDGALAHSPWFAASVDSRVLGNLDLGVLPFLRQHVGRIFQLRVDAAELIDGPGGDVVRETLREIRSNDWRIQIAIGLEDDSLQGASRIAVVAHAINSCLNGLR